VGDWEAIYPLRNPWWWVEWASVTLSVAWLGVEGFHRYGIAKLHRQFGLCDAMTGNRFLLWGLTGAFWMIYELAYPIQQIEFDAIGSYSASMDAIVSTAEFFPIACIWLVFFPPTFYRRWIDHRDPQPKAAEHAWVVRKNPGFLQISDGRGMSARPAAARESPESLKLRGSQTD
jgi:hypothetical protein